MSRYRVTNAEESCDCRIYIETDGERTITLCPLHKAAPALLAACELACFHFKLNETSGIFQGNDECEVWRTAKAAITAAKGATP